MGAPSMIEDAMDLGESLGWDPRDRRRDASRRVGAEASSLLLDEQELWGDTMQQQLLSNRMRPFEGGTEIERDLTGSVGNSLDLKRLMEQNGSMLDQMAVKMSQGPTLEEVLLQAGLI